MPRTSKCTPATRAGRRKKAKQFWDAAQTIEALADESADVSDAYVTLIVHAAIAASDVVCCAALGVHSVGENHNAAIGLLAKVESALADDLSTVLNTKTRAGYSPQPVSAADRKKVERAGRRLMDAMRAVPAP